MKLSREQKDRIVEFGKPFIIRDGLNGERVFQLNKSKRTLYELRHGGGVHDFPYTESNKDHMLRSDWLDWFEVAECSHNSWDWEILRGRNCPCYE
jgi:hypothetical protein